MEIGARRRLRLSPFCPFLAGSDPFTRTHERQKEYTINVQTTA
jgi:hypothetical protein